MNDFEARLEAVRLLLPQTVAVAAAPGDAVTPPLFDAEASGLGDPVDSRLHEFALGRTCARAALIQLGVEPVAIPVGRRRAPVWPPGVVGSIAHSRTFCVAAAAHATDHRGVGIDVEEVQEMSPGVVDLVLSAAERRALDRGSELIAFSAKEATFKVWWPLTASWLDFDAVRVRLDRTSRTFRAEIRPRAAGSQIGIEGRFAVRAGLVLTAVALSG